VGASHSRCTELRVADSRCNAPPVAQVTRPRRVYDVVVSVRRDHNLRLALRAFGTAALLAVYLDVPGPPARSEPLTLQLRLADHRRWALTVVPVNGRKPHWRQSAQGVLLLALACRCTMRFSRRPETLAGRPANIHPRG